MSRRIVSLLPSATEIVCALGLQNDLVGRSHECDFPPGVSQLPVSTAPKIAVDGDSRQIHNAVTGVLRDHLSVYDVDEELVRSLGTTHIVTQTVCEVCAVSLRDVASLGPHTIALGAVTLDGIFDDIRLVASAFDADPQPLCDAMYARLCAVQKQSDSRPRVAAIEWLSPLMAAGNWVPELIEVAGGTPVLGCAGEHSPWIDFEALVDARPDIVVLMPCGFTIERTRADLHFVTSDPRWRDLRARVAIVDGNQFFNRPGPRIVESAEILAEIFAATVIPSAAEREESPASGRLSRRGSGFLAVSAARNDKRWEWM
jgi:iron complex transport system substrate-binding protein